MAPPGVQSAVARLTRMPWSLRRPHPLSVLNLLAAAALVLFVVAFSNPNGAASQPLEGGIVTAVDARSYYRLDPANPYLGRSDWTSIGAFSYSPAFAQLLAPFGALPWGLFVGAWAALMTGAVYLLTGPRLFLPGLLVAAMEISGGNVALLVAAAIVLGFRWPAAWAFPLLTKLTPGVGLLWFALRREWRSLALALGTTAAVVAVSWLAAPAAWPAWFDFLRDNAGKGGTWAAVPIPLVVRGPIGILLIAWGARRDARWTVPVGAMLALPALWYGSLAMLLAVLPLKRRDPADASPAPR